MVGWVEPDGHVPVVGFPFVSGPDVGVEEGVGVAEDFDVDAAEFAVGVSAGVFDGGGEVVDAFEVGEAAGAG